MHTGRLLGRLFADDTLVEIHRTSIRVLMSPGSDGSSPLRARAGTVAFSDHRVIRLDGPVY
jgi:hypothetical protein